MIVVDKYEEVAALVAAGETPTEVSYTPALGRVVFTFNRQSADVLANHRRGALMVSSLAMASALNTVKDQIFRTRSSKMV